MSATNDKEWFRTWFDSPYYSILYKNRGESEAAAFIERLIEMLDLPDRARVLDLACGKGRHSVQLHQHGFRVIGIDLSNNSISAAKELEKEGLHFETGDMRSFDLGVQFKAVFNLFTSFGYFETVDDNKIVLKNIHQHLASDGLFVMDYFNAIKVQNDLLPYEIKSIEGVDFEITKKIEDGHIIKNIDFDVNGNHYHFTEKVQLIMPEQFEEMLHQEAFQILHTFGDYRLESFDAQHSDRFITISMKK